MTDKKKSLQIADIRNTGKNKAVGQPPNYFSGEAIEIWHEIRNLCPEGTFESKDALILETLCVLLYEQRSKPKTFSSGKFECLLNCYEKCLMTPGSRAN